MMTMTLTFNKLLSQRWTPKRNLLLKLARSHKPKSNEARKSQIRPSPTSTRQSQKKRLVSLSAARTSTRPKNSKTKLEIF